MRLRKPTVALIAVSILAMAAGVVAGTLVSRLPSSPAAPSDASRLTEALQLSADQRISMQGIWERVRDAAHSYQQEAQQLQRQRDDAIFALLNDEQKARYTQLTTECFGKIQAINGKRQAAFDDAVQQTRKILTDSQRKTYDQIIQSRTGRRPALSGVESPEELSMQHAP